jgi:hypothetical protein
METNLFNQAVKTLEKSDTKQAKSAPMGQQVSELALTKNADKAQESSSVTAKKTQCSHITICS